MVLIVEDTVVAGTSVKCRVWYSITSGGHFVAGTSVKCRVWYGINSGGHCVSSTSVKCLVWYGISSSSCCLLLLFLTFSVLVANPKKLLYTVANPARGLLNREKRTKEKVLAAYPPPPTPHTARSEKINKITRRIYRRYAGGRSRVRTRIPSARRLGLWVWLRKILHSRLR